jgi:hypothetical protein
VLTPFSSTTKCPVATASQIFISFLPELDEFPAEVEDGGILDELALRLDELETPEVELGVFPDEEFPLFSRELDDCAPDERIPIELEIPTEDETAELLEISVFAEELLFSPLSPYVPSTSPVRPHAAMNAAVPAVAINFPTFVILDSPFNGYCHCFNYQKTNLY